MSQSAAPRDGAVALGILDAIAGSGGADGSGGSGGSADSAGLGGTGRPRASSPSVPHAAIFEPPLGGLVAGLAAHVRASVQPEAVQAVAETFSFPLGLMVVVLAFLFVQHRLDRRDPKLRGGPAAGTEIVIPFVDEQDIE